MICIPYLTDLFFISSSTSANLCAVILSITWPVQSNQHRWELYSAKWDYVTRPSKPFAL
jgi:hypothetical protein